LELISPLALLGFDPQPLVSKAFAAIQKVQLALSDGFTSSPWLMRRPDGSIELAVKECDFIFLLHDLEYYFELFALFQSVDETDFNDEMISKREFCRNAAKIAAWGGRPVYDAAETFAEIDADGTGKADLDEFITWALQHHLNRDEQMYCERHKKERQSPLRRSNIDWAALSRMLPSGRDDDAKVMRNALFEAFDEDDDGALTLSEAEDGVGRLLRGVKMLGIDPAPVLRSAFAAARGVHQRAVGDSPYSKGAQLVERSEFRILLANLRYYLEVFGLFQKVDDTLEDDDMITRLEFLRVAPHLRRLGTNIGDFEKAWRELDRDQSGKADFNEFLNFALNHKLQDEDDPDNTFDMDLLQARPLLSTFAI